MSSLIPYEPFRHLDNIRREFDRFFIHGFPALRSGLGENFGNPSIDIYQTEKEVVAKCDIPGLEKKEDVNIDIENNNLTISGAVNRINEIKEENLYRQERFSGRFQRSVSLPSRVSAEGVKATTKTGSWRFVRQNCNRKTGEELTWISIDHPKGIKKVGAGAWTRPQNLRRGSIPLPALSFTAYVNRPVLAG